MRGLCVGGVPLAKTEVIHDLVFGWTQFPLRAVFDREHIPTGGSRHTTLRCVDESVVDVAAPAKSPTVSPPDLVVYWRAHNTRQYCAQLCRRMASACPPVSKNAGSKTAERRSNSSTAESKDAAGSDWETVSTTSARPR